MKSSMVGYISMLLLRFAMPKSTLLATLEAVKDNLSISKFHKSFFFFFFFFF